eukprot:SAG31_NODE_27174_length_430_cov_0.885196_1_plen_129_part_01
MLLGTRLWYLFFEGQDENDFQVKLGELTKALGNDVCRGAGVREGTMEPQTTVARPTMMSVEATDRPSTSCSVIQADDGPKKLQLPWLVRFEQQAATVARLEAALEHQSTRLARLETAQMWWICSVAVIV